MLLKRSILILFLLILPVSLTACENSGIDGPTVEPVEETAEAGAQPTEEALPTEESEAYPAPEQDVVPKDYQPYPATAEGDIAAEQPAQPSPLEENQTAADETAYPAPEAESEEPTAAQEENTLLAEPDSTATLTNRIWTFEQFDYQDGQMLLPAQGLLEINTIEFFEDGRVSIIAGCNVARGAYSAEDGAINIQAVNQTQTACDSASLGNQFLQWLNQVGAYRLDGESLSLQLPSSAGEMQLQGSEILTFGDQYARFLATTASLGIADAQPETVEELMDASLEKLVYQEGDPVNLAFGKAPGAVVLIQSPQGSMVKAAGLADIEGNKPLAAFDRLEIGSNTKMFTGVLLAQLQEEGSLSLDDPLSRWLPDLVKSIPNGEAITLRHLATHTSGIPDYGDAVIGAGAADSEALRSGYTPQELVLIATESAPPDFAPGEPGQWKYSNTGYILLGMVLESASGRSYGDLLQQRIFSPLGMSNSELLEGVPYPDSIVDGYFVFPYDIETTEWNGTQGWAAGGIISTAADMAKFAQALMTGALFDDPATLNVMTDFIEVSENEAVGTVGGTGYGTGLIEFAPGLWGHRGQTVGFTSIIAMDPAKEFVFVALTNSAEGSVHEEQPLIGHYLHLDQ